MLKIHEIIHCLELYKKKIQIFNYHNEIDHQVIFEISTDSRKKHDFFIALEGEKFDGHDFISNAIESGATIIVFEMNKFEKIKFLIDQNKNIFFIGLEDFSTINFYGFLANFYRKEHLKNVKILAITGSVGKTTLKNLLGNCLLKILPEKVFLSYGNFNNFVGVPYNIFKIPKDAKFAVLELGMNNPNEISCLSKMIEPDFAIIGNISPAHIGNFCKEKSCSNNDIEVLFEKAFEKIAFAKAEIFDGLKKNGLVILNKNLPFFEKVLEKAKIKTKNIKTYSFEKNSTTDLFIENLEMQQNDDSKLITIIAKNSLSQNTIQSKVKKNFNENLIKALLPIVSFLEFSNFFNDCEKQIGMKFFENFSQDEKNLDGRGALKIIKNLYFIDESYNAGFDSILASIQNLKNFQNPEINLKRKIIILGQMGEVGVFSEFLHGKFLKPLILANFDLVILIGGQMLNLYKNLNSAQEKKVLYFQHTEECLKEIKKLFLQNDLILIKGSNNLGLWKIIDFF